MATKLPYLNVLEVDSVNKEEVSRAIVIDKDEYVKALDIEQITTYQGLSNKPKINGVELNGDMSLDELNVASKDELDKVKTDLAEVEDSIPSVESIQSRIDDSLLNYPTKTEVTEEIIGSIKNKADKSEIPTKVSQLDNDEGYLTAIPDEYITSSELEAKDYATKTYLSDQLNTTLDDYYTKEQIDNKGYLTEIPEEYVTDEELQSKNYATEQWVEDKGYLTSIPTEYVTETELSGKGYATEQWVEDKGYLTSESLTTINSDIDELETSKQEAFQVNQPLVFSRSGEDLVLDVNLDNYVTDNELDSKQDKLISGTNIKTINGNSLLGEGNIEISGGGDTTTVLIIDENTSTLIKGTYEDGYNALTNKEPILIYVSYMPALGPSSLIPADTIRLVNGTIIAYFHTEYDTPISALSPHTHTINVWNITSSSLSSESYTHSFVTDTELNAKQDKLTPGDNINITNNVISWEAPDIQFVNTIFTDDESLKYAVADFNGSYIEKEFPLATTESAGLMSPEDKSKLDAGITGTTDYNDLTNKPSINSVTLEGNKDYAALGLASRESVISLDAQAIKKYSEASTVSQISIIRVLTQEEYDALDEYFDDTQYLIV